ncbi:MAG: Asp23/Gls24 family envelope stress response protein [Candidatus Auribacterota bacterium]|jgi:uncharacterized alkaline shock family protein YloU|uniref:Asp23/Gls24 family envelope stress response protein n=1 Tax=Candidatus Auribacter fodinae TaxID=2093366 RepID=A0A3A4RD39_9BACT|nr:MAG: Asp23/Gls24 family envelope stress response protein [Candidatus Auribacter fodinae]
MAREKKSDKTDRDKSYELRSIEELDQLTDSTVISDDVIAVIAYMAVREVTGVSAMGSGFVGDIVERFGKKTHERGIKVQTTGENVVLDISIYVDYGVKIPDISVQIQNNVRKAVEEMAGKKVVAINLIIQGVKIPNADEKDSFSDAH